MGAAPSPRRRSDAERNRVKILAAARAAFFDGSAHDVSMAEIARRAGIGMATLYRNFPGRLELLEALMTDEVDALCAAARTDDGESPGPALTTWLRKFAAFHAGKHRLAVELLRHTDASSPIFGGSRERVLAAGRPLLAAARAAGEVRPDLDIEQAVDLVLAVVTIDRDDEYVQPILQAALDGLRAR